MAETLTASPSDVKSSWVSFQNSQGLEFQASLLRVHRHHAVFELYSPEAFLRASEVLSDLRIVYQDRPVYSGRAVIRNLVNIGPVSVCNAALEDSWLDLDLAQASNDAGKIEAEFDRFMQEWQKLYRIEPAFKEAIADLQSFLSDLRLWLDQVELGIRSSPSADRVELERSLARRLETPVVSAIRELFDRFEQVAQRLAPEDQPAHWAFGKRQLHPLLLSSPFVYRTLRKPLGYAGDYEMVNMMFRDSCEGASLFSKLINMYALRLPPIVGHRSRIDYLTDMLQNETLRMMARKQPARLLSLGCGPAHEVQNFLARPIADFAHLSLVDFNDETLRHISQRLEQLKQQHCRATSLSLIKKSVQTVLKEAARRAHGSPGETYSTVYCAGLFDYLSDKVCRQLMAILYDMVAPGGLLVVTNVDHHPNQAQMECFLEWHLMYRNRVELLKLVPPTIPANEVSPVAQDHGAGVNLFLEIRKPGP